MEFGYLCKPSHVRNFSPLFPVLRSTGSPAELQQLEQRGWPSLGELQTQISLPRARAAFPALCDTCTVLPSPCWLIPTCYTTKELDFVLLELLPCCLGAGGDGSEPQSGLGRKGPQRLSHSSPAMGTGTPAPCQCHPQCQPGLGHCQPMSPSVHPPCGAGMLRVSSGLQTREGNACTMHRQSRAALWAGAGRRGRQGVAPGPQQGWHRGQAGA